MALKMIERHHWRKAYKRWERAAIARWKAKPPLSPQYYEWSYHDKITKAYFPLGFYDSYSSEGLDINTPEPINMVYLFEAKPKETK